MDRRVYFFPYNNDIILVHVYSYLRGSPNLPVTHQVLCGRDQKRCFVYVEFYEVSLFEVLTLKVYVLCMSIGPNNLLPNIFFLQCFLYFNLYKSNLILHYLAYHLVAFFVIVIMKLGYYMLCRKTPVHNACPTVNSLSTK